MFLDNQVVLDLLDPNETGVSLPPSSIVSLLSGLEVSSIFIASLDDIGFISNQCEYLLSRNVDRSFDFILTNAALAGVSVRSAYAIRIFKPDSSVRVLAASQRK